MNPTLPVQDAFQVMVVAGLVGTACFGWLLYFRWRAEKGEEKPLAVQLVAVVGGFFSAFLGLLLFRQLEQLGVRVEWEGLTDDGFSGALRMSLLIGAVEESAKLFPVLLAVRLGRRFDRPQDGLIVAACAGIGFAGVEAVVLWLHGDMSWLDLFARAMAAPFTHALLSLPWGWGLAASLLWGRSSSLLSGLGLSIASHGLYDWMLASPEIPKVAAALAIFVLWLTMIRLLTRLALRAATTPAVALQRVPTR